MSFGGYEGGYGGGYGGGDPFAGTPFASAPMSPYPPAPGVPPPAGEVNTLATLSVVFAFVFAPVGAVLGHVALSQIKRRNQPGRNRAVLGVTLSYVFIVLAVVALVVWLVLGKGDGTTTPPSTATSAAGVHIPSVDTHTTVVTQPTVTRETIPNLAALQVGDCVEVQQLAPNPNEPPGTNTINTYRVPCEVRDGVFQVTQIFHGTDQCPGQQLFNRAQQIFVCTEKYNG